MPPVAEARIWLAFLTHQPLDPTTLDPVRAFPFRSETAAILEKLLTTNDNWFLRYQLALIYHDRNRISEARALLDECGDKPAFAPFYAFRAALYPAADSTKTLHDLQHAASLDPQWRYQQRVSEYFIAHHDPARAETIAAAYYNAHTDDYRMGMLYAKTLLLNRRYADCDHLLARLNILPFEGATAGRELYREALLMEAVGSMRQHQYKKALDFIARAKKWPENLGVGEPYLQDQDLRLEDWMTACCNAGLKKIAAPALPVSLQQSPGAETNKRIIQALQDSPAGLID